MTREIKFRGLCLGSKTWVYGDLLSNNGSTIIVNQVKRPYIRSTDVGHWHIEVPAYRVIPESVGQYTGLKDKNGVDIYEGDILEAPFSKHHVSNGNNDKIFKVEVKYSEDSFEMIFIEPNEGIYRFYPDWEECEITGNIHQESEVSNV